MKVYSINPNSGKYFEDNPDMVTESGTIYIGRYNYTPIYPLYTVSVNGRVNHGDIQNEIKFYTMLPIKRLFRNYLVEIHFEHILSIREKDSLNIAIDEFNNFCETNKRKLNVHKLIS